MQSKRCLRTHALSFWQGRKLVRLAAITDADPHIQRGASGRCWSGTADTPMTHCVTKTLRGEYVSIEPIPLSH
jgi:hypothetical protein